MTAMGIAQAPVVLRSRTPTVSTLHAQERSARLTGSTSLPWAAGT